MQKILVTGATGRLGANVVKALTEKGYSTRSFVLPGDPKEEKLKQLDTEIVYGDLATAEGIEPAVAGMDAIVHSAAVMGEPQNMSRQKFFDINTRGTFALLDAAVAKGGVERFVLVSSTAVYDTTTVREFPATEDAPLRPPLLYGLTKILDERMALIYHFQHGLPVVALRPNWIQACDEILRGWNAGAVIGFLKKWTGDPRASCYVEGVERPWEIIEKAMESPDQLIIPRGPNGESWCEHRTDVRDVVQAVLLSLETDGGVGEIFNVCAPKPMYKEEAVKYLAEKTGQSYIECTLPILHRFAFDNSKAERLLGYRPEYDVKKMIDSALAYRNGEDIGVIPA